MVLRAIVMSLSLPALLVLGACSGTGETGSTPTTPTTPTTPSTPSAETTEAAEGPVTLRLPAAGAGRCMAPSVARLAQADVAFDGTVEDVTGSDVEIRVDSWFTGSADGSVVVTAPGGARTTELIPVFREGERYLVAASGTSVIVCGVSDVWSPELEELYRRAFG